MCEEGLCTRCSDRVSYCFVAAVSGQLWLFEIYLSMALAADARETTIHLYVEYVHVLKTGHIYYALW